MEREYVHGVYIQGVDRVHIEGEYTYKEVFVMYYIEIMSMDCFVCYIEIFVIEKIESLCMEYLFLESMSTCIVHRYRRERDGERESARARATEGER